MPDPVLQSDPGLMDWAFKGVVSGAFIVGGWLWAKLMSAVAKNRDSIIEVDKSLSEYKIKSVETFATKTDVAASLLNINDTVKRIHDRLDDLFSLQRNQQ